MKSFLINTKKSYNEITNFINQYKKNKSLENIDYKDILEHTYNILNNSNGNQKYYNIGLSAICHIAEIGISDNLINQLLNDCIVSSRIFLYKKMLHEDQRNSIESVFDIVAQNFYTLPSGTILTKEQKEILNLLKEKKKLIISAPTSFGKSKIIEEIILSNNYKNIGIILPTIALLSETYLNYNRNKSISNKYNLINNLSYDKASLLNDKNVFILTPEKMDLLLDENPTLKFDFFVMDEIYKIQDIDDDRSKVFTNCLYRLANKSKEFYLIGPYYAGFSKTFLKKTGAFFKKFDTEIVQKDIFDLSAIPYHDKYTINSVELKKFKSKDINLKKLLNALNDQTLIYVGRKDSVETRAKHISKDRTEIKETELIKYIKDTISNEWSLCKCLEKGVAFHHASVPKYIQIEIVDAFNNNELDIIVCTSTLIEGVNTSAKNVIIYDNFKGQSKLDGFDVKNITGRAGRFLVHFIGRVYYLEPMPEGEKGIIEFNYFDNKNLAPEELILIKREDLKDENLIKREYTENFLREKNVPLSQIRKNKYIPIHKQLSLIKFLRNSSNLETELFFNSNIPSKEIFSKILELCYNYLFNNQDVNDRNFSFSNLKRLTNYYIYKRPSLKELISIQDGKSIDTKIRVAFKLITRYFEFSMPRYLSAFENIYNFVYFDQAMITDKISLKYIITLLEFGFENPHEIALKGVGLPNDIIKKIGNNFSNCSTIAQIRIKYKINPNVVDNLSDFEKRIVSKYL